MRILTPPIELMGSRNFHCSDMDMDKDKSYHRDFELGSASLVLPAATFLIFKFRKQYYPKTADVMVQQ